MWPVRAPPEAGPFFGHLSGQFPPVRTPIPVQKPAPEGRLLRTRKKEHHATDLSYRAGGFCCSRGGPVLVPVVPLPPRVWSPSKFSTYRRKLRAHGRPDHMGCNGHLTHRYRAQPKSRCPVPPMWVDRPCGLPSVSPNFGGCNLGPLPTPRPRPRERAKVSLATTANTKSIFD